MLAVFLDYKKVLMLEVGVPTRPPGCALIRLRVAGICNTDLELQRGYYGFRGIPGHEFVGQVVAADSSSLLGQRVVGEINLACRRCSFCKAGLGRHCAERTVLGIVKHSGAFAEYLTLPEENLHVLPEHLPDERAVFVEPLAAACEILEQVQIEPGVDVAVLGDGKLGLLIVQTLLAHGARVSVFGRHANNLRIAEHAGALIGVGSDFPIVVDSTGSPDGLRQAVSLVRPRGTVVMKSTVQDEVKIDMAPVIVNEITLVGSRCGLFEPALKMLSEGKVDTGAMLAAEYPLSEAPAAFAKAAERGVLKVLLRNTQAS